MNTEITGKFLRVQISENITIGVRVAQHSYRSLLAHSPILCLNNDLFFDVCLSPNLFVKDTNRTAMEISSLSLFSTVNLRTRKCFDRVRVARTDVKLLSLDLIR